MPVPHLPDGGFPRGVSAVLYHAPMMLDGTVTKVRDAMKRIEEDGWYLVRQRGSHRQYKHPTKAGRVTIAGQPNKDLHPKTYRSILTRAQLEDR